MCPFPPGISKSKNEPLPPAAWNAANPAYAEVFDELNRRGAVVFAHPTTPTCYQNLLPEVAPFIAEVPQDTARAVISLLVTGTLHRNANIQFVFAHAGGGTLPMLAGRIAHTVLPPLRVVHPRASCTS
jgi:Amidohydrolase